MQIEIKTKNLDLTPSLRTYVEKKMRSLNKFTKRFEKDRSVKAYVELAKTTEHHKHGNIFYAEVNLEIDSDLLRIESTAEDMHAAIDEMKDKLKRELLVYKDKKIDKTTKVKRPGKPRR